MRISAIMLIVGGAALVLMLAWAVIDANVKRHELDDRWE